MIKYCMHGGWVKSRHDGDQHYVSAVRLIRLYGLDPKECVVSIKQFMEREDLIHLHPRYDGNYRLPT
jgi:hypothetical protein